MKLRNEVVVAAPLEETWRTLLDVPRVASALPGATIEPGGDGDHRGRMRVKIGPVTAEYTGTVRLEDVDEDAHVVSFHVQGSGSQGTVAATITGSVSEDGGDTRLVLETDLRVTGRAATFGRGLMEEVSARTLVEFARRLEDEIVAPAASSAPAPPASRADEVLDVGAPAWELLIRRYALPTLTVLLVLSLFRRPKVIVIHKS